MRLRDFIHSSQNALAELYGFQEASALVSRLCEGILACSSYAHIVEPELEIALEKEEELQQALERLLAHEPLQYILGYADFLDMRLRVSPAVLIPRPETEDMCMRVIRRCASLPTPPRRILDLCSGSGCITWAMAKAFPQAEVYGVDISQDALDIARAQSVPLVKAPCFLQADVLEPSQLASLFADKKFDIVLSNPPYVCESEQKQMQENVLCYEPELALFVPDTDPLRFYEKIATIFAQLGDSQSLCALEINENFSRQVASLFPDSQYNTIQEQDLNEKNRFVFAKKIS